MGDVIPARQRCRRCPEERGPGEVSVTAMRTVGMLIECSSACRAEIGPRKSLSSFLGDHVSSSPSPQMSVMGESSKIVAGVIGFGDRASECRQIDERLEERAGLPVSLHDAVELATW